MTAPDDRPPSRREQALETVFRPADHDHARCLEGALGAADALCAARGLQLTPLRRRVLELVWESHHPQGAYDILERLARERGKVAPPTVYRTLAFLAEHGLVHRIDTLNAFVGCARPGDRHAAYFLICRVCRTAAEIADSELTRALAGVAARAGFELEAETVELTGVCPACR